MAHGPITFKPWLPLHIQNNEVAVPKGISLEREDVYFLNNL